MRPGAESTPPGGSEGDAEVAVPYPGYWSFIPRQDVNSRSVLAILEILFSLQDSDDKTSAPVLTLPASR